MSTMMDAFNKVGIEPKPVTPWNPSWQAKKRVKNPLPVPEQCPHCTAGVSIKNNSYVYGGRQYGDWPWVYVCDGCGAHVGMHPETNIPLGTLATKRIRDARKKAKDLFNPLWHGPSAEMTRTAAYNWLAYAMNINVDECHIGWFDESQCNRVIAIVKEHYDVSSAIHCATGSETSL